MNGSSQRTVVGAVLIAATALQLVGCAGFTRRIEEDRAWEAAQVDTYVQAPDSVTAIEETQPAPTASEQDPAPVLSAVPEEKVLPPEAPAPAESASFDMKYISGYRVQLFATRDPEKARAFAESTRPHFEAQVYVEYLEPYYKVRLGDCPTREEAALLLEEAKRAGFDEAWIASTLVLSEVEKLR